MKVELYVNLQLRHSKEIEFEFELSFRRGKPTSLNEEAGRQTQERARDTTKTKTSVLENGGTTPENEDHFGSSLNRIVNPQRRRLSNKVPS